MSDNCKWDSSKHNGQPCPTHNGGGSEDKEEYFNSSQIKNEIKLDTNNYKKDFDGIYTNSQEGEMAIEHLKKKYKSVGYYTDEKGYYHIKASNTKDYGDYDSSWDVNNLNNKEEFDNDFDEEFESLSDMLMTNEDDPVVTKGSKVDAKVKEYLDKNWDSIDTNKSVGELAYKISGMIGKPYTQVLDSLQKELPNRLKEDDKNIEEKLLDSVDEDIIRDSLKQDIDPKYHKMIDSFDKESMKQGILGNNFDDDYDEEFNDRKGLTKETLVDKFNDAHLYNDGDKYQLALSNGKTEEFDTYNKAIDRLSEYSNRDYSWAKKEESTNNGLKRVDELKDYVSKLSDDEKEILKDILNRR